MSFIRVINLYYFQKLKSFKFQKLKILKFYALNKIFQFKMDISLEIYDNVVIKCKSLSSILSEYSNEELENYFKYKVFLHEETIDPENEYLLYVKDENYYVTFSHENEAEYVQSIIDENAVIAFRNINLTQAIEAVNGINRLGLAFCVPKYISKIAIVNNILFIKVDN